MPTLEFKGKQYIYSHHHSVPFRELEVEGKKSLPAKDKKPSLDDNLIIHGDNLHALKALMPQYAGKVRCIYIDPPYNTGNEGWCYNDNVNSPLMKEWIKKNANPVDKEDLERHDKWLCMMYPRLKLLHELLADDGVIFVSIDDNEVHHLRAIMDEIWGENKSVGKFIWRKKEGGGQTDRYFVTEDETILVYKKTDSFLWLDEKIEDDGAGYTREDANGKYKAVKLAKWGNAARREDRPKQYFSIKSPDNKNIFPIAPDGGDGRWRVGKKRMDLLIDNDLIQWEKKNGAWIPYEKVYFEGDEIKVIKERSIIYDLVNTADAAKMLVTIFGKKDAFENPKPYELIRYLLQYATDSDALILDSFGGSGTTAHAVLALNKEDGGNRKFILVECEDYADSITAERVRRVINGVPSAKDETLKAGLGGSFTFCELGKEISIEKILTGEALPAYDALAKYVFYTATGKSLEGAVKQRPDAYVGETDLYEVYLIYQPDIAFLRSNDSALNIKKLEAIAERKSKKEKLVFATAKYMGQKELSAQNITFCQLPYAIHKVVGA